MQQSRESPLHEALSIVTDSRNNIKIITPLLEAGANPNARIPGGDTPTDLAVRKKLTDVVDLFAQHGGWVIRDLKPVKKKPPTNNVSPLFGLGQFGEDEIQESEQLDYLKNLTALAEDKDHNPFYGREREIEQVSNALRRKNMRGVVLVGEPGVGKTAIVEALAYMVAKDKMPKLAGREIFSLDVNSMWGHGDNMWLGQLHKRVNNALKFIVAEPDKRILFIDEIHQLLGGRAVAMSSPPITDILKPYLGRGDMMLIGATTYDEYQQIIEGDRAIVDRLLRIDIEPPSAEDTLKILQDSKSGYEEHYGTAISSEALSTVVSLSNRYLTAQQQPRKAVNLLDEALTASPHGAEKLTEEDIAAVIAEKLNIDINTILMSTSEKLKGLLPALQKDIYGQDDTLADIASVLSTALIGFADKTRPLAAVLLAGDPGVGKTETAKALARYWFDSEDRLITADMSRFKHPFSVGELADFLTRAVKAKPHAVILLDEVEKAHREVHHLLLQLLDEGRLTDSRQHQVDFTNTIIIFTTNSKDIKHDFAKELQDRLNAMYTYNRLDKTATTHLINKQLAKFNGILQEKSITVSLSDEAIEILAKLGYGKQARGTANVFERLIKHSLTQGIIQGAIHNDNDYHIDLQYDGNTTIEASISTDNEVVFELSIQISKQDNNERPRGVL